MQRVTSPVCRDSADRPRLEILSINNSSRDCKALQSIVRRTNWRLHCLSDLAGAVEFLNKHFVPVVVCASDLEGASWLDVLDAMRRYPTPPEVLVYAGDLDAAFALHVLEAGGFDALSTPFESEQVLRSISLAFRKWKDSLPPKEFRRHAASVA